MAGVRVPTRQSARAVYIPPMTMKLSWMGHPGGGGAIPHLKGEMWGTRAAGARSHISKARCGAPEPQWRNPTSQRRDVGHPGGGGAIPHLKGEMWGTRASVAQSHISKARCRAPGR